MNPRLKFPATTTHPYVEVEQWCLDHIGEWNVKWYKFGIDPMAYAMGDKTTHYWFADEQSAVLFKLKWT